jgi:hypothetical protein
LAAITTGILSAVLWKSGIKLQIPPPTLEMEPILYNLFTKNIILGAVGFLFFFMLGTGAILNLGLNSRK